MLDALARVPLWKDGMDYRHGTGHGVGAHLCVHEGPHLISYYPRENDPGLVEGMTVTVEPGWYEEGAFGVRLENVTIVTRVETRIGFDAVNFLQLQPVTLAPFQVSEKKAPAVTQLCSNVLWQRSLIEVEMLSEEEIQWLNSYHARVFDAVSPLINDAAILEWLKNSCAPLS